MVTSAVVLVQHFRFRHKNHKEKKEFLTYEVTRRRAAETDRRTVRESQTKK